MLHARRRLATLTRLAATLALGAALLLVPERPAAQTREGDSGLSGNGQTSGSGSSPIKERQEQPRGLGSGGDREERRSLRDRPARESNRDRQKNREKTNRAAATAEQSAGVAQQGLPAGAAARGLAQRASARVITGGAAETIGSRAPSTSVVFNYKVPEGLTVLHFDPADLTLVEGQKARVALKCHNPSIQPATRLHAGFRYNPAAISLVGVDPRPLTPFLRRAPKIRVSPERGLLLIEVEFAQPVVFGSNPLLFLEWKGLSPSSLSQIEVIDFVPYGGFEGERPLPSALYNGRRNIIGAKRIRNDGWVPLGVEVLPDAKAAAAARTDSFDEEARRMADPILFGRGARGGIEIELEPEREELRAGEEMDVRAMFYNPRRSDLDLLRLTIEFDPKAIEIVDTDEGNAIAAGVNILEGNRRAFPFDYFVQNKADNHRGYIEYRMGRAGEADFPEEGVLATIRVRAKNLSGATRMEFKPQVGKAQRGSTASFNGKDVLGSADSETDGLVGARFVVR